MSFAKRHGLLLLLGALFALNAFIWLSVVRSEGVSELTVTFLNVGQGDAALIEGPFGGTVLIDAGPDARVLSELGAALPFGTRQIDVAIDTHPDADHFTGFFDVLKKYDVGEFVRSGVTPTNDTFSALRDDMRARGAHEYVAARGMLVKLGGGAVLTVLFPDRDVSAFPTNEGSIIARLDYGKTSILFTGDTDRTIESYLVAKYAADLDTDVLKVAHHGSKTSTGWNFIEAASPEYAVISVGAKNRYGHPNQATLDSLQKYGVKVFRTDDVGRVLLVSDGSSLSFR